MSSITDLINKRKLAVKKQEPKRKISHGVTVGVDYDDSPQVINRPGFVWVRENKQGGGVFQCFNPTVKLAVGLPVTIMRESGKPSRRIIQSVDWDALMVSITSSEAGKALDVHNHHRDHEFIAMFPGLDVVNIYPRAIVPLKIYPGTAALTLSIASGYYMVDKTTTYFAGLTNQDISAYIPAVVGHTISVLVFIDSATNLIGYLPGNDGVLLYPVEPDVPDGDIGLGYVRLAQGMSGLITESMITNDPRPFISIATGAGGSGDMLKSVYDTNDDGTVDAADYAPTNDHGHTATGDGGPVEGSVIKSTGVAATKILTADGSGNSSWEPSTGGSGIYPQRATMWHDEAIVLVGNPLFFNNPYPEQNYNYVVYQDSSADGDSFSQSFMLVAGIYDFYVLGILDTVCGILDWYIDDVLAVGSQDWYDADYTPNVIRPASVTITGNGRHTLKAIVNGKNPSADDGWRIYLTKYWFAPSADTVST
jgi:hypothetical protein